MAKDVLDINPDSLTSKECEEFSRNPHLKRIYESKWGEGITNVCGTDK